MITPIIECGMKLLIHSQKFNGAAVEVWSWINNFFPHFSEHVITNQRWAMLVKGVMGNGSNVVPRIHSYHLMPETSSHNFTQISFEFIPRDQIDTAKYHITASEWCN